METEGFHGGPQKYRVLVNYIRAMCDLMGRRDAQFVLRDEPPDQPRFAQVQMWGDSLTFDIWIGRSFFELGPRMQREVICHELLHTHTDQLNRLVRATARNVIGGHSAEIFGTAYEQSEEMLVDGIACAWARFLPFIDWTDERPLYVEYEADNRKDGEFVD